MTPLVVAAMRSPTTHGKTLSCRSGPREGGVQTTEIGGGDSGTKGQEGIKEKELHLRGKLMSVWARKAQENRMVNEWRYDCRGINR